MQSLILLLQKFAFPNIGEEELLSQIGSFSMHRLDSLEQLCRFFVLAKCRVDEDKVLNRVGVLLI